MKMTKRTMTIDQLKRFGVVALSLSLAACGGEVSGNLESAPSDPASDALAEGSARLINVEVEVVEGEPFSEIIRLTGAAWANQDVTVSSEESGVVRAIVRDKGTVVRTGEWLIKIDDRILKSQVAEARAQADLAQQTWERRKRLYEDDRVGSELAYLEAKYAAEQTAARLSTLRERLARTVVRAPIDGVLDMRYVEVGTMVGVGTEIARVVSLNPVKIVAGVPERYASDVKTGGRVTVEFPVLDQEFDGAISYVGATVNASNRTFGIELVMENPGGLIKPEMVANLQLVRQSWDDAVVIPQESLIRTEDGFSVFVAEDGIAVARPVEVGASQKNVVMIESGLEPGDQLVVVGQKQIAAGDRVNIVGTN
jgi:RND family efflux transporter MFP subunit